MCIIFFYTFGIIYIRYSYYKKYLYTCNGSLAFITIYLYFKAVIKTGTKGALFHLFEVGHPWRSDVLDQIVGGHKE